MIGFDKEFTEPKRNTTKKKGKEREIQGTNSTINHPQKKEE